MTVPVEMMQQMLIEVQRMNAENMQALMRQNFESLSQLVNTKQAPVTMTDTRGIGRPIIFKGDEHKWAEWKAKLLAYLRVIAPKSDEVIDWACKNTTAILETDVDLKYGDQSPDVMKYSANLYSILLSCTEDDPFRICHSVKEGNGLEALRLLHRRYEPRTPGTKRALLKAIINNGQAKKAEDIEKNVMHVEELMKKYEVMSGTPLPEDLRVTVIIDLCVKDLREHLELTTREMAYKEVREEIMSYVERKRNAFSMDLKAMDVDELGLNGGGSMWWGGTEDNSENWEYYDNEVYSLGGWNKGYGKKGGFKGFGKSGGKGGGGYKGDVKGSYKGDSKGGKGSFSKGDGKGKGGFNGYCHWCSEWGHSQSRCKAKDEFMDNNRKEKGYGKGGPYYKSNSADNVETHKDALENLEAKGGFRALCSLEHRRCCGLQCQGVVSAKVSANRFAALQSEDEEDDHDTKALGNSPPGLVLGDFVTYIGKKTKANQQKRAAKTAQKSITIDSLTNHLRDIDSLDELNTVDMNQKTNGLWITVDSGASENVIAEGMAPGVKTVPSSGSRNGVQYVAANGMAMPNRGEQHIQVLTEEGHQCTLNMQVTDVKKALMSVARVCDAGHEVLFTAKGGEIHHLESGQVTKFNRVDNVYRLQVGVVSPPVFSRPGSM
jgi:hypothetical protein